MIRYGILFVLLFGTALAQQNAEVTIYNPKADAARELREAESKAAKEHKHLLVQVGGNWCSWCVKLEKLYRSNDTVAAMLREHYVLVHLNYSKENKNLPLLARYGYPQRFGFPVLLVLDARGNRLHTQDSGLLEQGGAHSAEKVLAFLSKWTPAALDPKQYRE